MEERPTDFIGERVENMKASTTSFQLTKLTDKKETFYIKKRRID